MVHQGRILCVNLGENKKTEDRKNKEILYKMLPGFDETVKATFERRDFKQKQVAALHDLLHQMPSTGFPDIILLQEYAFSSSGEDLEQNLEKMTGKKWKLVDLLHNNNNNNKLPPRMLFRTDIYQSEGGAAHVVQLANIDSASTELKKYHRDYLSGRYSGAKLKLIADGRCQLTVLSYHGRNNSTATTTTTTEEQQQVSLRVEDRKNASKALIKLIGKHTCEKSPLDAGHWKPSPAIIGGDWNIGFRDYIQDGPPYQKGANWTAKIPPVNIPPHGVKYYDGAHIDYFVEIHPSADNIASLQMDQPVAVPHTLEYKHFFDHDPIAVGYCVYLTANGLPPLPSNISFNHPAAAAATVDKKAVAVLQPSLRNTTFTNAISNLSSSRLLSVPSPSLSSKNPNKNKNKNSESIKHRLNAWQQQGEEIVVQLREAGKFEDDDEDDVLEAIAVITSTLMDKIDIESNDISTPSSSRWKEEGRGGGTKKRNQTAQPKSGSINVDGTVPYTPSPMKIERLSFITPDTTTTIRSSNVLTNNDDDEEEDEEEEEDNNNTTTTSVSSYALKPSALHSMDETDNSGGSTTTASRKQCSNPECMYKCDPNKGYIKYNRTKGGFPYDECHHCRKEKKKKGGKKEEKEDLPVEEEEEGNEKGNLRWYHVWPFYRAS